MPIDRPTDTVTQLASRGEMEKERELVETTFMEMSRREETVHAKPGRASIGLRATRLHPAAMASNTASAIRMQYEI